MSIGAECENARIYISSSIVSFTLGQKDLSFLVDK